MSVHDRLRIEKQYIHSVLGSPQRKGWSMETPEMGSKRSRVT